MKLTKNQEKKNTEKLVVNTEGKLIYRTDEREALILKSSIAMPKNEAISTINHSENEIETMLKENKEPLTMDKLAISYYEQICHNKMKNLINPSSFLQSLKNVLIDNVQFAYRDIVINARESYKLCIYTAHLCAIIVISIGIINDIDCKDILEISIDEREVGFLLTFKSKTEGHIRINNEKALKLAYPSVHTRLELLARLCGEDKITRKIEIKNDELTMSFKIRGLSSDKDAICTPKPLYLEGLLKKYISVFVYQPLPR